MGTAAVTLASLPKLALANDLEQPVPLKEGLLTFKVNISFNHGHHLDDVSVEGLILSVREINASEQESFQLDIKGNSGHSHLLTLTQENIAQLLFAGELSLDSEVGAGHTHKVDIKLS